MALEKLDVDTYFGRCKCCFNYGYLRTMWEKHIVEGKPEMYGQMLTQCFSISWTIQTTEEDDQICGNCICKLREAYLFKKQVIQCQKVMEKCGPEDIGLEIMKPDPKEEEYTVEYLDEDILKSEPIKHEDNVCSENEAEFTEDSVDETESQVDEDIDEDQSTSEGPPPRKRQPRQQDSASDSDSRKWPRKLPYEERYKTYRQYPEENLQSAIEAVTSKRMSQKDASGHYQVPRKTLCAKIRDNDDVAEKTLESDNENSEDITLTLRTLRKHRDNIHSVLAYSNATPIRGFWRIGYVCSFCTEQFPTPSQLKTHTKIHGDLSKKYFVAHVRSHVARLDITELKCRICNEKQEDLNSLMHHLKDSHGKPMHFDVPNHLVPFKFDKKELECVECGEEFKNFKSLSEHMANVHFRNYVCDKCDRGFINKVNLLSHKDTHKTGIFNCNFCGKFFNTRRKRFAHERFNHVLHNKSVKCGYCQMRFLNDIHKNNHELRMHMKEKVEHNCNYCDKSYARERALRDHINKVHLVQRQYTCYHDGCDKRFVLKRTLLAHTLTHKDRPFSCKLCPKTYRSEKSLKEHNYTHDNKTKFKCPKCSKTYVLMENMKLHLKSKH